LLTVALPFADCSSHSGHLKRTPDAKRPDSTSPASARPQNDPQPAGDVKTLLVEQVGRPPRWRLVTNISKVRTRCLRCETESTSDIHCDNTAFAADSTVRLFKSNGVTTAASVLRVRPRSWVHKVSRPYAITRNSKKAGVSANVRVFQGLRPFVFETKVDIIEGRAINGSGDTIGVYRFDEIASERCSP
jgi:hypothetical protein